MTRTLFELHKGMIGFAFTKSSRVAEEHFGRINIGKQKSH